MTNPIDEFELAFAGYQVVDRYAETIAVPLSELKKVITDNDLNRYAIESGFTEGAWVIEHGLVTDCQYVDERVRVYLDENNIITEIVRG